MYGNPSYTVIGTFHYNRFLLAGKAPKGVSRKRATPALPRHWGQRKSGSYDSRRKLRYRNDVRLGEDFHFDDRTYLLWKVLIMAGDDD
ncbi:hypothetical protein AVEN_8487-1 [Araneus ventricosus]|uniref:Uncharacterized protein n=1 Tax=Araneus ventricosus TaxID=182803 RepID=A0A4Y2IG86_ARAVE|nr:hypothetical protein AVEN_8487-1 [Araneus ventricosus]